MRKILFLFFSLVTLTVSGQNYLTNGSLEYGLNTGWNYEITSGSTAQFTLDKSSNVMDGNVALKINVRSISEANVKSSKASTQLIAGNYSLYLLRFWA